MVTVTKIDKDEIPEVSNKYLMRGDRDEKKDQKNRERRDKNSAEGERDRERRYVSHSSNHFMSKVFLTIFHFD